MLIHVDFGVALAVSAVLHLTWHLNYYLKLFSGSGKNGQERSFSLPETDLDLSGIKKISFKDRLPVWTLGFTAILTQLVLLRAFLSVFQGNELVLGVILGNWMLLTGLGAWLGRKAHLMKNKIRFVFSNLLWLGALPLVTGFLLFFLKNQVFIPGSLVGLFSIFLGSLVLLSPFCLLSGYSFSFYASSLSEKYHLNLISRIYSWEAFGSLTGGILFSFLLVFLFKSLQILGIVLIINMIAGYFLIRGEPKSPGKMFFITLFVLVGLGTLILPVDRYSKHFLFRNQKILFQKETPFGSLVLTKIGDQVNFYENNVLISNTLNTIANEENVHYALLQLSNPKDVLIISGGISGIIPEINKYPIRQIDYVEINPWIIRAGKKFTKDLDNDKVHVIIGDARRYVPSCTKKYDAILINLPPPLTAQLNRYYTLDFFLQLKKILRTGGVVSLSLPASPNYTGREGNELNSLIYATLKKAFKQVLIVPGEKNYFLASGKPLRLDIARLVKLRGIKNDYVSEYYIQDDLLRIRNQQIMERLKPVKQLNTDIKPVAYFKQISLWLSYYRFKIKFPLIVLGLFFLFILLRSGPVSAGMFAGGFAASSVEVLLLFTFQILYGYVYLMTGILITVFMAGIAFGALSRKLFKKSTPTLGFIGIELLLAAASLFPPLLITLLKPLHRFQGAGQLILFIFTFLFAFLVGRLFGLASGLKKGSASKASATLYGSDLAGGALGALLVSGILLPLTGIWNTALFTGLICLLAAFYIYIRKI